MTLRAPTDGAGISRRTEAAREGRRNVGNEGYLPIAGNGDSPSGGAFSLMQTRPHWA